MDYLKFYELDTEPFQNDLDSRFYYESTPQRQARMRVLRGIQQRKALTVVYGGPGRGKTTLAHNLLRDLTDGDYALRFLSIPHEGCASGWFVPNVARQYGIRDLAPTIPQLIDQVHARLIEVKQAGKHPVLFVDEAQLFRNASAMEEFRGLLNLLHDGDKLVSMVLFGLHELGQIIKLDPPLAQRVDIRVELVAMDRDESEKYLEHRIKSAGGSLEIFTSDAIDAIYAYSGGVPRLINTLADNTLFDGLLSEANPTDGSIVAAAAESLGLAAADASETPSGLELEPGPEAMLDSPVAASATIQPLDESTSGGADWLEPPAPMPDSMPAATPTASVQAPSPPVDAALLEEAAAALDVIAQPGTAPPEPDLSSLGDDFPPLNREFEFEAPAAPPAAAPPAAAPAAPPAAAPPAAAPPAPPAAAPPAAAPAASPAAAPAASPAAAPAASPAAAPAAPPAAVPAAPPAAVPAAPPAAAPAAPPAATAQPDEVTAPSIEPLFDPVQPAVEPGITLPLQPGAAPGEMTSVAADDTEPSMELEIDLDVDAPGAPPAPVASPVPPVASMQMMPLDDDDSTPLSLPSVITPEMQEKLRAQFDAARAPAPPAAASPAAAEPTAAATASAPPAGSAAPAAAPAAAPTMDETFRLGSILDEGDDGGPKSEPRISVSTSSEPNEITIETDAGFDLGDLLTEIRDERESSQTGMAPVVAAPAPAPTPAPEPVPEKRTGPRIEMPEGDDDDLDSLFDSIQLDD